VKRDVFELCSKLELQNEVVRKLKCIADKTISHEIDMLIGHLVCPETAEQTYKILAEMFGEEKDNSRLLFCYLNAALITYQRYQELNIPDDIYFDTMKSFTRFIGEQYEITGEYSFQHGDWMWRHISMQLFRIGQLEYEFYCYQGEKVISIHIPSDVDFRNEMVEISIEQARIFMREYYPDHAKERYMCYSWLLSPKLRELLGENSNIIKFQEHFDLVETGGMNHVDIQRIFKMPVDTKYSELRECTSLQRKVKKRILNGEGIGFGCGFLR